MSVEPSPEPSATNGSGTRTAEPSASQGEAGSSSRLAVIEAVERRAKTHRWGGIITLAFAALVFFLGVLATLTWACYPLLGLTGIKDLQLQGTLVVQFVG